MLPKAVQVDGRARRRLNGRGTYSPLTDTCQNCCGGPNPTCICTPFELYAQCGYGGFAACCQCPRNVDFEMTGTLSANSSDSGRITSTSPFGTNFEDGPGVTADLGLTFTLRMTRRCVGGRFEYDYTGSTWNQRVFLRTGDPYPIPDGPPIQPVGPSGNGVVSFEVQYTDRRAALYAGYNLGLDLPGLYQANNRTLIPCGIPFPGDVAGRDFGYFLPQFWSDNPDRYRICQDGFSYSVDSGEPGTLYNGSFSGGWTHQTGCNSGSAAENTSNIQTRTGVDTTGSTFPGGPTFVINRSGAITRRDVYNGSINWTRNDNAAPNDPCPPCEQPPIGACCVRTISPLGAPVNCYQSSEATCLSRQGSWREGVSCVDADCPVFGSCCVPSGACYVTTNIACRIRQGIWTANRACTTRPCRPADGACCLAGGGCLFTSDALCNSVGGAFQGPGSTCVGSNCPPPTETGSCCLPNGQCFNGVTREQCLAKDGAYLANVPCTSRNCVPIVNPPPRDTLLPPNFEVSGGGLVVPTRRVVTSGCSSCGDGGF